MTAVSGTYRYGVQTPAPFKTSRDGNTLQFSKEENLIVHHDHKDGIETVHEFTIVTMDKLTAQK
jgi:hypothetical protein